jgi:hypothetical protein
MVDKMTVQKKDNRGYIFPNTNKNKPTQPDFTGKATIDGKDWQMAAWENKTPEGKRYLSFTFSVPLAIDPNAPATNNTNSKPVQQPVTNNQTNTNKPAVTAAPISDDLDDLDAILRSADDDNPFN